MPWWGLRDSLRNMLCDGCSIQLRRRTSKIPHPSKYVSSRIRWSSLCKNSKIHHSSEHIITGFFGSVRTLEGVLFRTHVQIPYFSQNSFANLHNWHGHLCPLFTGGWCACVVCVRVRAHTHTTCGVLGYEPRCWDETPGEPGINQIAL